MRLTLPILIVVCAALGCALDAQQSRNGNIDIRFVVPDDQDTNFWLWPEAAPGQYALALPFHVKMTYTDSSRAGPGKPLITRKLELLADRALIWFEPEGTDDARVKGDPLAALRAGIKNLQFYGEGHVWMKYSVEEESITFRADRAYLDFTRALVRSFTATGEDEFKETLSLTGRMSGVKAHSGADEAPAGPGLPIGTGAALGEAAGEARDPTSFTGVGEPPSDDVVPNPTGPKLTLPQERGRRLFLRAQQLRILTLNEKEQVVQLEQGSISSSSLSVASYSMAAESLTIRLTEARRVVYITRPSVRVLDVPLLTLDVTDYAFDLDSSPPIRQFEVGRSNQYGYWLRSYVDAVATYDFLWDPEPPYNAVQMGPQVDWFSARGLGLGLNLDWGGVRAFEPFGRASFRGYSIRDRGDDRQRARELGWFPLEDRDRGRVLGAYSQNFGAGWQLDNIFNYESDRNFRREFYDREYKNNAPLGTYIMLTRRAGAMNYYLRLEPRIHPWQNRTEYLPTLGFDVARTEIGDFGLQLSSRTEASLLVFRPTDDDTRRRIATPRVDTTTWFNLPFQVGVFAFDPYVGARATGSTHFLRVDEAAGRPGLSPDGTFAGLRPGDERQSGLLYRVLPFFGANLQTFITGTFPDFRIQALGIDGLRHVLAPFVRYNNVIYNSLDDVTERAFIAMDAVDTLDEFHEIRVGFRNRLQTRTGKGEARRTVDYFEVMAELPIYPNHRRDNDGRLYGDLEVAAQWRVMPSLTLSGSMFLDPLSGNFNRATGSMRFDVTDICRGHIYYRLLKGEHQVVGAQLDFSSEAQTYALRARQEYDLENGDFLDTRIEISRRVLESFELGFVFARDAVKGDVGFYFSISASFRAPKGGSSLLR